MVGRTNWIAVEEVMLSGGERGLGRLIVAYSKSDELVVLIRVV